MPRFRAAIPRSMGCGKNPASEDPSNNVPTPNASVSLDLLPLPDVARGPTPDIADDPSRFESAKQKKTTLMEGIKRFNQKPKKVSVNQRTLAVVRADLFGTGYRIPRRGGLYSRERSPRRRQVLAEYGWPEQGHDRRVPRRSVRLCHCVSIRTLIPISDEVNVTTMHAFVDMIDLRNTGFVDALRTFLQAFRLPGEAQKIDRYKLKFAERYIEGNTQTPFANAGGCAWPSLIEMMLTIVQMLHTCCPTRQSC